VVLRAELPDGTQDRIGASSALSPKVDLGGVPGVRERGSPRVASCVVAARLLLLTLAGML